MKNIYSKIFFVPFFTIIFFTQYSLAQYTDISADSAYALTQANINNPDFIILDVRTYSEYTAEHIENGVNLDRYNPNLNTILDTLNKNKKYLIHCLSGSRSAYVFGLMQTKGYTEVYNMLGGINAWKTATYPTTTLVAPIMLPVYDTIITPLDVFIGNTDTITITVTNYGNDTLKFLNITDLSGTEFIANFDINAHLTGLHDYTFNIFYTAVDAFADYLEFIIESTGGTLVYPITRNGIVNVLSVSKPEINIYPNPSSGLLYFSKAIKSVTIYNIYGNIVKKQVNSLVIDLSDLSKGSYFAHIALNDKIIVKKIMLIESPL